MFHNLLFRFLTILIVDRFLNYYKHLVFFTSVKLSSEIIEIFKTVLYCTQVCFEQPTLYIALYVLACKLGDKIGKAVSGEIPLRNFRSISEEGYLCLMFRTRQELSLDAPTRISCCNQSILLSRLH